MTMDQDQRPNAHGRVGGEPDPEPTRSPAAPPSRGPARSGESAEGGPANNPAAGESPDAGPANSPAAGESADGGPAIGDPAIDEPVAALESLPADDLAARLDAGERLHQVLTDRMAHTGRDGG